MTKITRITNAIVHAKWGSFAATLSLSALIAAGFTTQLSASSIIVTWQGSAANNQWSNSSNWTGCTTNGTSGGTATSCTAGNLLNNLTNNEILIPATYKAGAKTSSLDNEGSLTVDSLTIHSGQLTGGFAVNAGDSLTITGTNQGSLFGGPTVTVQSGGTLSIGGALTNSGILMTDSAGTLTLSGTITNTSGTIQNGGGTLTFSSASVSGGTLTGVADFIGADTLSNSVTLNGSIDENSGSLDLTGDVTGSSNSLILNNGTFTLSGQLNVTTADLLAGSFEGTGAFNAGTVNNGDGSNNSGTQGTLLDVGGSYASGNTTQAADYTFTDYNQDLGGGLGIAFNSAGSGNDELISNNVALNGTLDLWNSTGGELNVNTLNTSLSYVLIDSTSGAVSGQFSTINALHLAGVGDGSAGATPGWWIVYNGHSSPGGGGDVELDYVPTSTPEPAAGWLLGGALAGLGLLRKRAVRR